MNMKYKFIKEIGYILIILLISWLLNNTKLNEIIPIYFQLFDPIIYIFITILVFYYFIKTIINPNNLIYLVITYLIFLIIMLFFRKTNSLNIQTDFYLIKWIKLLFTNRTVFINVFGNILIFIPFGFILKFLIKNTLLVILISLLLITLIEYIQYKTLVGVFDIVDIILNYLGTVIGILEEGNVYERRTRKS